MTLILNPITGNYEGDFKGGAHDRLHISLRTKRKAEGMTRHAAVQQFYDAVDRSLMTALRHRKITVQQIAECVKAKRPFESLRRSAEWPTLNDAAEEYLLHLQDHADRSTGTYDKAKSALGQLRAFVVAVDKDPGARPMVEMGDLPLNEIVSMHVAQFFRTDRDRGLEPYSITLKLRRLITLYNWYSDREPRLAREENRPERVLHSPVLEEWLSKAPQVRTRFLERIEAATILAATPDALRFPVLLGLLAGLRGGEVATLRPEHDLDLANGVVIIQSKEIRQGVRWFPKSRKTRHVPIGVELIEVARHHLAEYSSDRWLCPGTTDETRPIAHDWLNRHLCRVVDDVGLISGRKDPLGITFHTLRHTFASWLVMEGVDLKTVATLMGHSTTHQVEVTYSHLSPDHKRRAVDSLGAWYSTIPAFEEAA